MITKAEVNEAISRCEPVSGWASIDVTPTTVSRGDLHTLIEAAKRATYVDMSHNTSSHSNSDYWLTGS